MKRGAVFLDRDGVLIEDVHLLTEKKDVVLREHAERALARLVRSGLQLFVITNQTVISRGLATADEVDEINRYINLLLANDSKEPITKFYVCPHHPEATLQQFRLECECRKPRPGMLHVAAKAYDLDLSRSYLIGDRMSDIAAGRAAGCQTILLHSGKTEAAPIVSAETYEDVNPDFYCSDLLTAVDFILGGYEGLS